MRLPILKELESIASFAFSLGLIMNIVTFVLFSLSVVLIYSLILMSTESNKYNFSLLKIMGLPNKGLIFMIIT